MGTVLVDCTVECTRDEVWRTAVHEAGHAVFAYHYCIPIHEVWIGPDRTNVGQYTGAVLYENFDPQGEVCWMHAALMFAGQLAEDFVLGARDPATGRFSCSSWSDLRAMAALFGYDLEADGKEGDEADETFMKIDDAVSPLVRDVLTCRKAAVIRLARALVKKNRLTGAEVTRIIHRHRNRRDRNRVPQSLWAPPQD